MTEQTQKLDIRGKAIRIVAILAVVIVVLGVAAYAWLSHERAVAGIALVDSPRNIYITSAHKEDLIYLDLTDINLEDATKVADGLRYKDYVFSITGENIKNFKLQLAYTTNNRFSFEIYDAEEARIVTEAEFDAMNETQQAALIESLEDYDAVYASQGNSGLMYICYNRILPMQTLHYFNLKDGNLGDEEIRITQDTYTPLGENRTEYQKVNQYAYPIYCQTDAIAADYHGEQIDEFYNYFILRVKWPPDRTNDGETDIIYLSAAQS